MFSFTYLFFHLIFTYNKITQCKKKRKLIFFWKHGSINARSSLSNMLKAFEKKKKKMITFYIGISVVFHFMLVINKKIKLCVRLQFKRPLMHTAWKLDLCGFHIGANVEKYYKNRLD